LFLWIGPKRSGKGTIARVLKALIGEQNLCGPTLATFGQPFGMQSLLHNQAAIIADARIGPKSDVHVVVERILSITGEDTLNVQE
jgi:putative DNA primase/helicase